MKPSINISTEVARPVEEVWRAITSPKGVNAELSPLVRMTFPAGAETLGLENVTLDEPLLVSTLLLFGVLPFDRHTLIVHEIGPHSFVETSHSLLQKLWRHERSLTPTPRGTLIRDVITVVPRLGFAAPMTKAIAAAIFRHRHRKLPKLFN